MKSDRLLMGKVICFLGISLLLGGNSAQAADLKPIPPVVINQTEALPPAVTIEPEPAQQQEVKAQPPEEKGVEELVPLEGMDETAKPTVTQPLGPAPEAAKVEKIIDESGMYFNVSDEDIGEVIKQVSRALGKNFLLEEKSCKGKVTIISERKMTPDEIWETFLSALDANGCTIRQGPAGLYRLIPTREAISHPIDLFTDKTPHSDRYVTRLITLKNISATDMSNVIKALVSKEGNLLAYPVTNTLILTDKGTNIERLLKLIGQLDKEGPQEILEIIPVIYADAKDIADKITQIFEEEAGGKSTASAPRSRRGAAADSPEEIPAIRKIIPDDRTNTLIVLASKRSLQDIRGLIKKLDTPLAGQAGEIHVHYMKHAKAQDIASVLSSLSGAVSSAKDEKGAKTRVATATAPQLEGIEFLGKWTVTADESTNALVITASAKDYQILVDRVIDKLDIPRRQVYVEAVIVEFLIKQNQQLGMGTIAGKSFNVGGSQIAAFGSTFGFLPQDMNSLLGGSFGAGNTSDTITINTPGAPGSGTATQMTVPAFFTALQLAQGNTDVNILSTPNILTLDNEEAVIEVGQKVPFVTTTATTVGGSVQGTIQREEVSLKLTVKPQISASETIRLEVDQIDQDILDTPGAAATIAQGGPRTSKREIKTVIVANDGQTVVLGGLIKDKFTTSISKVPILGDIPILGWLFKTRKKEKEKVNLVVFLTPHIIDSPRDFLTILKKKVDEKNAFVDENFNENQKKQIRHSMTAHAKHLLESQSLPPEEIAPPVLETPLQPPAQTPSKPQTKKKNGEEEIDLAL